MRQSVLIVDDMSDMLRFLTKLIRKSLDVDLYTAINAEIALEIIVRERIGVILTDVKMPKMNGIDFLKKVKELDSETIVIMMTAFGSIESAVESLKLGAYDYVTKPFDEERLIHVIRKALEHFSLTRRTLDLEQRIQDKEVVEAFVGQSRPIRNLVETIQLVAKTDATVLITGETGTGKDLTAKTVHALSARAKKPFVAVNCPAIPGNILESELFGYKKGAFTGAGSDKDGLFETADGGTIFLDEIADISPILQAKLLRVLQEKEVKPLGDNRTRKVDVRIIASTNRNLEEKIATGEFREDLYYRLNVVTIRTPPLREIPEDIPVIAGHFLSLYCAELGVEPGRLSEDALKMLVSKKWNGNVRELQNELKRAAIFSKGDTITPDVLGKNDAGPLYLEDSCSTMLDGEYKEAKKRVLDRFDVQYIIHILQECDGNVTLAARKAGLERQSLHYLMRKHDIDANSFRGTDR